MGDRHDERVYVFQLCLGSAYDSRSRTLVFALRSGAKRNVQTSVHGYPVRVANPVDIRRFAVCRFVFDGRVWSSSRAPLAVANLCASSRVWNHRADFAFERARRVL